MNLKNILIPRPMWYPDDSPASRRVEGFKETLPNWGWSTTLLALTPPNSCGITNEFNKRSHTRLIQISSPINRFKLFDKVESRIIRIFLPQYQIYWRAYRVIKRSAVNLLNRENYDAIFITYPMLGTIQLGHYLHHKFGIPWIVDFRDVPGQFFTNKKSLIIKREINIIRYRCKTASAFVTVSDPLAHRLKKNYGFPEKKIHVIHNGYNEWDYSDLQEIIYSETFDIVYCGTIGNVSPPTILFKAIDNLLKSGFTLKNMRIFFYGRINKSRLKINEYICREKIIFPGMINRKEVLKAEKKAAILLSLSNHNSKGIFTSKIFEYACIGRPVLSIPPDNNVLDDFIKKAKIGLIGRSVEDVSNFVLLHYKNWKKSKILPTVDANTSYLSKFNRNILSKKLSMILNSITGPN